MKNKKLFNLSAIILGVITLFSCGKIQATESVFGSTIPTRSNAQAYIATDFSNSSVVPITLGISQSEYKTNNGKVYWTIKDSEEKYKDIYCLNLERGFGAPDGNITNANNTKEYNKQYDLNTIASTQFSTITGLSTINKNKISWILNNALTSEESLLKILNIASQKVDITSIGLINKDIEKYIKEDMISNTEEFTKITFEDIKIVQQIAIWHYTNNDSIFENTIGAICNAEGKQISGLMEKNIDTDGYGTTIWNGKVKQAKLNALYQYFIDGAESGNSETEVSSLTLSNKDAVITESEDSYIVGPFSLTGENTELIKEVVANVNVDYTLLETATSIQGVENNNFAEVINDNFYLKINKADIEEDTNIEIDLTYKYNTRTLMFLTDESDPTNTQPVVLVETKEQEKDLEIVVPISLVNVSVEKVWDDNNNQDGDRPTSIKVQLYKDNKAYTDSITLSDSNNWTYTWTKLLDGYNYTVKELNSNGNVVLDNGKYNENYIAKYQTTNNQTTITNKYVTNEYSVKLLKVGEDGTTAIPGATFKIDDGKLVQIPVAGIEIDNGKISKSGDLELEYKLEEITAPEGYIKLLEPINVKIKAKVELIDNKYQITEANMPDEIEGVTISEENNVITIKVENKVEVTGKYNIVLRKVDTEGNKLEGSKFKVSGTEYDLPTGEVVIYENQQITSDDNIERTYIIEETVVPVGYNGIEMTEVNIKAQVQKIDDNFKLVRANLVDSEGNNITDENISIKLEGESIVIEVKNTPIEKKLDLSLRKFITQINDTTYAREPIVDTSKLGTEVDGNKVTTATYKHTKQPIVVQKGDVVTYTIRVYNEGEIDGYVEMITDHVPDNLLPITIEAEGIDKEKYADEIEFNLNWGWVPSEDGKTVTTMITRKDDHETYAILTEQEEVTDTKLNAYVQGSNELDYIDVQIKCLVTDSAVDGEYLTNIAEISKMCDADGVEVETDIDSTKANADYSNLGNYKNEEAISSDTNSYVEGQEDDDDFEKLWVKEFDLSLRKFITKVNEKSYLRAPVVDTSKLGTVVDGKTITTAIYNHSKEPVIVETGDLVTYKIRIYNEGSLAGFANEITDDLPKGLEFLPDSSVNVSYRWEMLDSEGNKTEDVSKAVMIVTDYLSDIDKNNVINAVTEKDGVKTLSYKDVEVQFKVVAKAEKLKDNLIINEAQISGDSDRDIDSEPNRDEKYDYTTGKNEDDIDYEPIKLQYFDLALRKFVTKVNSTDYNNRYPEVVYNEDVSIKYNHTKDPVLVTTGDTVVYTIRVYNEGEKAGTAAEIKDNLPEGLEFLPDNEVNKKFGWKLIDESGNVTEDLSKAKKVTTNILENETIEGIIKKEGQKVLSYKDVEIVFKVTEEETSNKILVNTAEISKDSDDDVDSTPDNNVEKEDDLDKEYVKVRYFDLSLKKWVIATKVTYNGKTTTTKTGFTEDSEGIAKVDLVASKMKKTTVKFIYSIKVTNEGELPGYASEVKDYIPSGLKFVKEDNKDWKEVKDGVVVTDKLKDTLLNPGESATVEMTLTWKNSTTNLGLKTNYAEISKDSGNDIDSTPDNYNKKEDDIDDAQVILSIKTAGATTYVGLILTSVSILAVGIFLIKKYVIS